MATVNWERVARATLHPIQVGILEALAEDGQLSPMQHARTVDEGVNLVAYHFRALADKGLIECVGTRQRRGATEHFYGLAEGE